MFKGPTVCNKLISGLISPMSAGVFPKWIRNSVNSANSGNLINHLSMNWAQFKDPVSHMCLAVADASWILHNRWQLRVLLITNIQWKNLGKSQSCVKFSRHLRKLVMMMQITLNLLSNPNTLYVCFCILIYWEIWSKTSIKMPSVCQL